jgi:hypothetical protein
MSTRELVAVLAPSHSHFLSWVGSFSGEDKYIARQRCRYVMTADDFRGVHCLGYVDRDAAHPSIGMRAALVSRVPFEFAQAMGAWYAVVNGTGLVVFGPQSFADVVKNAAAFYGVGGLRGGF